MDKTSRIRPRFPQESLDSWTRQLPTLFRSGGALSRDVSAATRKQLLRKLGPRLYTSDLHTPLEQLTRARAVEVASLLLPGAVISYRSALEMVPRDGTFFLTTPYERTLRLPGLTLRAIRGPGPQPEDMPVLDLYRASDARAMLENLKPTRVRGVSRALPRTEIEERLERTLQLDGEERLNRLGPWRMPPSPTPRSASAGSATRARSSARSTSSCPSSAPPWCSQANAAQTCA